MNKRVVAVIIRDNKILLTQRIKGDDKYFVFPGGKVRESENLETATTRQTKDEFNIDIKIERFLFRIENKGVTEFYFLIEKFEGEPEISGEEKQIINDNNQRNLQWKRLSALKTISNLFPKEAKDKVQELIKDHSSHLSFA